MKREKWYLIATRDRLELPVFYARYAEEVADWLGVTVKAVYTAFARSVKSGTPAHCGGYILERIMLNGNK